MTVSGETLAAAASFLALKPIAALAIRHWTGSNLEPHCALAAGAVYQRRNPHGDTARTQYVEDQKTPVRAQHLSKISLSGLRTVERSKDLRLPNRNLMSDVSGRCRAATTPVSGFHDRRAGS